jgi:hypothetical protein
MRQFTLPEDGDDAIQLVMPRRDGDGAATTMMALS